MLQTHHYSSNRCCCVVLQHCSNTRGILTNVSTASHGSEWHFLLWASDTINIRQKQNKTRVISCEDFLFLDTSDFLLSREKETSQLKLENGM